jgi:pyrroloquinoline-quinone synthase
MDVVRYLDEARLQTNVLEHPFYERWSAGELSTRELANYAGEYRHAVVALARASELAARTAEPERRAALRRHAEEETAHIELWDRFAQAAAHAAGIAAGSPADVDRDAGDRRVAGAFNAGGLGADVAPAPARAQTSAKVTTQTAECTAAWKAGEDMLEHLAVLYAIEAGQPEISRTKLDGLIEHYGYTPDAPAIEYFRLHERLDVEHARQARELIEQELAKCPDAEVRAERMIARAHAALRGNWKLLSGVESLSPRRSPAIAS